MRTDLFRMGFLLAFAGSAILGCSTVAHRSPASDDSKVSSVEPNFQTVWIDYNYVYPNVEDGAQMPMPFGVTMGMTSDVDGKLDGFKGVCDAFFTVQNLYIGERPGDYHRLAKIWEVRNCTPSNREPWYRKKK